MSDPHPEDFAINIHFERMDALRAENACLREALERIDGMATGRRNEGPNLAMDITMLARRALASPPPTPVTGHQHAPAVCTHPSFGGDGNCHTCGEHVALSVLDPFKEYDPRKAVPTPVTGACKTCGGRRKTWWIAEGGTRKTEPCPACTPTPVVGTGTGCLRPDCDVVPSLGHKWCYEHEPRTDAPDGEPWLCPHCQRFTADSNATCPSPSCFLLSILSPAASRRVSPPALPVGGQGGKVPKSDPVPPPVQDTGALAEAREDIATLRTDMNTLMARLAEAEALLRRVVMAVQHHALNSYVPLEPLRAFLARPTPTTTPGAAGPRVQGHSPEVDDYIRPTTATPGAACKAWCGTEAGKDNPKAYWPEWNDRNVYCTPACRDAGHSTGRP